MGFRVRVVGVEPNPRFKQCQPLVNVALPDCAYHIVAEPSAFPIDKGLERELVFTYRHFRSMSFSLTMWDTSHEIDS